MQSTYERISTTEGRKLIEGLSRPVYYQIDLPTEAGEMNLYAQSDERGETGLYNLMRPNQGTLVLSFGQAVELLGFYARFNVTCRLYGGRRVPVAMPEVA